MGLIQVVRRRRDRRREQFVREGIDAFAQALQSSIEAIEAELVSDDAGEERTLAAKVLAGDAVVLGVKEDGTTIVAEKAPNPVDDGAAAQELVWASENARIDHMHRQIRQQFGVERAGHRFERAMVQEDGSLKIEPVGVIAVPVRRLKACPFDHDGDGQCSWHDTSCKQHYLGDAALEAKRLREEYPQEFPSTAEKAADPEPPKEPTYHIGIDVGDGLAVAVCIRDNGDGTQTVVAQEQHNLQDENLRTVGQRPRTPDDIYGKGNVDDGRCLPGCAVRSDHSCCANADGKALHVVADGDIVDDGATPDPVEIAAVMRAGICDDTGLLGASVLYETDGRGGKRYALPAIVTVVQRTHPDLPFLRAAEEQGYGCEQSGGTWYDTLHGERRRFTNNQELLGMGVCSFNDGIKVGDNPVPIPHDGTLHLKVLTPGPKGTYDEFSVPYDPQGGPRTWRFRTMGDAPF